MTGILPALMDLLGFERQRLTCELIDRLRPGHGHTYTQLCEPPACVWCGASRPALYRRKARPRCER